MYGAVSYVSSPSRQTLYDSDLFAAVRTDAPIYESNEYLSNQIITYLGNKRALLPFIAQGVSRVQHRLNKALLKMFDVFSGSSIVARNGLGFGGRAPVKIEAKG